MNLNANLIGLLGIGFLAYIVMGGRTPPARQVVIGTKVVKVSRKSDFSSAWKLNLPVPTNLFGSHPYGWSGSSPASYLNAAPND